MIKRLIIITALTLAGVSASAQSPYCCLTEGAALGYTDYDASGKETNKSTTTVLSASGSNGDYFITMKVETAGLPAFETTTTVQGGKAVVGIGGASIDIDGSIPFIPSRLAVGMELDCGTITVDFGGLKSEETITSHRVVDREELATPAGSFKCYVVQQDYVAKALGIKVKGSQKIWYCRGIGNVKMETFNAKGKLQQTQLLTSLSIN